MADLTPFTTIDVARSTLKNYQSSDHGMGLLPGQAAVLMLTVALSIDGVFGLAGGLHMIVGQ